MKRIFFFIMLLGFVLVYLQQQSYAEKEADKQGASKNGSYRKENHREYANIANLEIKDCNACHKDEGVAPNHDADFFRGHRVLADNPGNNCSQCHDQAYCLDCHQGGGSGENPATLNFGRDYKPKTHRSDFRVLHPIKALDNPQNCYRCHDQRYCNECHARFPGNRLKFNITSHQFSDIKLKPDGPTHANFQPSQCPTCHPNSVVPAHQWSSDHAREARRNLQSCQSCHEDGNVCIKCHSARTGLKVSPHPRNWGSIKGNLKDRGNGRSCIQCHDAGRF
ncbi:cytochrome C [Geobacter sp. SVR]|uniref:cytochrome C n=1 Tax=Geobacter sp. SVR TaxID=2495594 RepID=UPI00143EF5E9|nr:cytochrome C [Geobacter sp. SVR]BCS55904.1 cytochrome c [Geobacter sp. SVR]GCF84667.1 cytochrome c [Geobacter sp. SVR]